MAHREGPAGAHREGPAGAGREVPVVVRRGGVGVSPGGVAVAVWNAG